MDTYAMLQRMKDDERLTWYRASYGDNTTADAAILAHVDGWLRRTTGPFTPLRADDG